MLLLTSSISKGSPVRVLRLISSKNCFHNGGSALLLNPRGQQQSKIAHEILNSSKILRFYVGIEVIVKLYNAQLRHVYLAHVYIYWFSSIQKSLIVPPTISLKTGFS